MAGIMPDTCAIIVAGGSGTRFGNPGGKLLIEVAGRPVVAWTLAAFDAAESIGHIVVVCPPDQMGKMRERAVDPYGFSTPVTFAPSGVERQDSTASGLRSVPEGFPYMAIHDAARPLITSDAIDAAVAALRADVALSGTVCGQPAVDTLKVVDEDGCILDTPPRSRYWTVQTPQVFRLDAIRAAHERAAEEGFLGTDDASVVEHAGGAVRCVATARDNLKITVPEDLPVIEALLRTRADDAGRIRTCGMMP